MEAVLDRIGRTVLVSDGAMGTMLAPLLAPGEPPEGLLLRDPRAVRRIHADYAAAGADILTTNTFGAGRLSLRRHGLEDRMEEIVERAVQAARDGSTGFSCAVAGSIGPLGDFLLPFGPIESGTALEVFRETARLLVAAGVDAIAIETMTDVRELRLAASAVREIDSSIPLFMEMSFASGSRTVTGTPVEVLAEVAAPFGPGALGLNCGNSLEDNLRAAEDLVRVSTLPVIVQPNAGLPLSRPSGCEWPGTPEDLAGAAARLRELGASVIGSCCGSGPEHTRAIAGAVKGRPVRGVPARRGFGAASRLAVLRLGAGLPFVPVGERLNPTGRPKLARAIAEGRLSVLKQSASAQVEAGAAALDLNVSTGDRSVELPFIASAVRALDNLLPVPLFIDSMDPEVMEAALLEYPGRAVLNSLPLVPGRMEDGLELARRHGAAIVALLMDSTGVPGTVSGRLRVLDSILENAHRHGLGSCDIIVDPVVLAESACPGAAAATLEVIREVSSSYALPTMIGLSNASFGLPARKSVNRAFLAQAMHAGLSAAILDPLDGELMDQALASDMLRAGRGAVAAFISRASPDADHAGRGAASPAPSGLAASILGGSPAEAREAALELLKSTAPMELVESHLLPTAADLGLAYEEGRIFLPQLIAGAEAVRAAFDAVRESSQVVPTASIVLATVEGDVHDIGKNIVAAVLAGNGWSVTDLGRDVSPSRIVEAVEASRPDALGLSALLTPSLAAVRATVARVRSGVAHPPLVIIGGAVVSEDMAREMGVLYGRDAAEGTRVLGEALRAARQPGDGGAAN